MYTIQVTYTTGNSFGSHSETDRIGQSWDNIELAQQALQHIKEHYDFYTGRNSYRRTTTDQLDAEAEKNEWFTQGAYYSDSDSHMKQYSCAAEMDDGSWMQLPTTMWCGYFETLNDARIVMEEDERNVLTF